jgi:hypothetical protein
MAKSMSAIEKAKAKLKKLGRKGGGGEYPFIYYNLQAGKNILRVFPCWTGNEEDEFYKEIPYHERVGPEGKKMKCPRHIGEKCPMCEKYEAIVNKAKAIKKSDPSKSEALWKQAKDFRPKQKYIMNVVGLSTDGAVDHDGNPITDNKPHVVTVGPQVMEGILQQFVDDEADVGGKFWAEDSRYDFSITRSGEKLSTQYVVKTTTKYTDVDTSAFLENLNNIDELFSDYPSYAELKAAMNGEEFEEGDEEEETEVDEELEEEAPKKPAKKAKPADEDEEEEAYEEEEADEEEEEEEPAKKPAKKAKDEDEDDEEPEEEEEEEEAPKGKPTCFGEADDHDPKDKQCKKCPFFAKCAKVVEGKKEADADAEEAFGADDEAPAKKDKKLAAVKKGLKKRAEEDEDEEDDVDM